MVFIAIFFFLPGIYTIYLSFFDFDLLRIHQGPRFIGLQNFLELIRDPVFPLSLYNTFVHLTLVTVGVRLILGLGIALLLNCQVLKRLKLMGLMRSLILIPWLIMPVVAVEIWRWLYHDRYGAINLFGVNLGDW